MKIAFALLISFFTLVSKAQTNSYLKDLQALRSILQNTPSYKAQIKGEKLLQYNRLYDRLALDTPRNPNSYEYFYNLAQLLFSLRDNHLGFYQLPAGGNFKTNQSASRFVASKEFEDYPTCKINLDSLKTELAKKPVGSIEGIYHYDRFYSVGLFKSKDNEYIGVVLDSDIKWWPKGQVAIHLYQYGPNLYKAIYGHPDTKNFILLPVEKYRNQSLVNSHFYASFSQSVYSKQLKEVDHVNLTKTGSVFAFRDINDDVQYLLIQTFQVSKTAASKRFYDSIKTLLKASNLILDLRNNEGGAKKEMIRYFWLLKKYVKHGRLYLLINNGTLSQAEIFTLKLKQLKNVTLVGQTTKGMLSYGSNYGKTQRLPSEGMAIYTTDMKNGSTLLQYEDFGISPDIFLKEDSDWIKQAVQYIRTKYSTTKEEYR